MFIRHRRLIATVALVLVSLTTATLQAKEDGSVIVVDTATSRITIDPASGKQKSAKKPAIDGAISPDGKRIAYVKEIAAAGKSFTELFIAELDKNGNIKNERRRTNGAGNPTDPQWLPDGKHVAYVRGEGKYQQVYTTDVDAEQWSDTRASAGGVRSFKPRIAPDGTIAYLVERSRDGKVLLVDLMIAKGREHTPVAKNVSVSEFAWSPDGKQIAFTTYSDLVIVNIVDGKQDVRALSTIDKRLYAHHARSLAWQPDGKAIAAILRFSGGTAHGLDSKAKREPAFCEREVFLIPLEGEAKWFTLPGETMKLHWAKAR